MSCWPRTLRKATRTIPRRVNKSTSFTDKEHTHGERIERSTPQASQDLVILVIYIIFGQFNKTYDSISMIIKNMLSARFLEKNNNNGAGELSLSFLFLIYNRHLKLIKKQN